MTATDALSVLQSSIVVAARIAAPILLLSMLVGLIISIFQAATQIHEQTITFVPKLLLIALVLFLTGSWMLQTLVDFANEIIALMVG
ncbi:MAG: flagellar biosynthesis protein FliQ [Oscillospiraceae bacterium]|nr:flagellar biosynthesis protein FliQ [Oscillospiraceae bacterium]